MDDPAHHLTWEIDDSGLDRVDARALRKAVDTCAHWLHVWNGFVRAGIGRPVTLVAALHDGNEVAVTADQDNARLRIAVPNALRGDADLPYQVFAGALEAIEAAAQQFPHSPPPTIWEPPFKEEPDKDPGGQGIQWQMLEPEEMLLIGSFVGADRDGLAMFHLLDEYVVERVAGTGIAEVVDTEGGTVGAAWTIALR
jgi:hypothetical protein